MEYQLIPDLSDDCFLVPATSSLRQVLIDVHRGENYPSVPAGMKGCSGKSTQAIKKVASEWDKNGQLIWKVCKRFLSAVGCCG